MNQGFSLRPRLNKIHLTRIQMRALKTPSSSGSRPDNRRLSPRSLSINLRELMPETSETDTRALRPRQIIEDLGADQEILMISRWSQEEEEDPEVSFNLRHPPELLPPASDPRPPLRVSNTNNSPLTQSLQQRKRAFSALNTGQQGRLLIRAGAGVRLDENMIPPEKRQRSQEQATTGRVRVSGSGQRSGVTGPGLQTRHSLRPRVLH